MGLVGAAWDFGIGMWGWWGTGDHEDAEAKPRRCLGPKSGGNVGDLLGVFPRDDRAAAADAGLVALDAMGDEFRGTVAEQLAGGFAKLLPVFCQAAVGCFRDKELMKENLIFDAVVLHLPVKFAALPVGRNDLIGLENDGHDEPELGAAGEELAALAVGFLERDLLAFEARLFEAFFDGFEFRQGGLMVARRSRPRSMSELICCGVMGVISRGKD